MAHPRPVAAAGPADGLREELVRPLRRALVGQVERDVGGDDADQRDLGDVEALRDEARPDEDVDPAGGEGVQHPLRRALALGDVAVEPRDPQPGEAVADLPLHALRPAAEIPDPRRVARRAAGRDRPGAAAVVAAERRPGLVVDERTLAVRDTPGPSPQSRHRTTDAVPRRFITRIARSPAAVSSAAERGREGIRTGARGCPRRAPRAGRRRSRRARSRRGGAAGPPGGTGPARACPMDSTDGVADPSTTAAPARRASSIAESRAWKRGVRSLL